MKTKPVSILIIIVSLFFGFGPGHAQDGMESAVQAISNESLVLTEAVMCETVKDLGCQNAAVVFSVSVGKISCFTVFDPVPEKAEIHHNWYKKDVLSTQQRLVLEPPAWRTYSSIQLRESDKGPWHVEIIGPKGKILKTLRFSISD